MRMRAAVWTNPSVVEFASDRDPVDAITSEARRVVFHALEQGWSGPPFDPFALADLLSIETVPTPDVLDARLVPTGGRPRIEFNPDRPRRRIRYSIFHEIAHTLFPDFARLIRNRGVHNAKRADDWQLETLCNVAAAEFLLPAGTLGSVTDMRASVDTVLELRRSYESSAEAALLRITRLTTEPAIAFSSHRDKGGRYALEYAVPTASLQRSMRPGMQLPINSAAEECTAIGYTAKRTEHWPQLGQVRVECVGIAPQPRDIYPRVIGFAIPAGAQPLRESSITYVRGDATRARGTEPKLLLQVVNNGAFTWGGVGFAAAIKRRWPQSQKEFTVQVTTDRAKLKLGSVVACELEPGITLLSLVAQQGYGPSTRPRIRYGALRDCLVSVSQLAKDRNATVHMPRIGTGQAGGAWPVVQEIVAETLVGPGVGVLVYDLPEGRRETKTQGDLALGQ